MRLAGVYASVLTEASMLEAIGEEYADEYGALSNGYSWKAICECTTMPHSDVCILIQ